MIRHSARPEFPYTACVRRFLALWACCLTLTAWADVGARRLLEAKAARDKLDLVLALQKASDALRAGDLGPKEVIETYALLGELHAVTGDAAEAQRVFGNLLTISPGFELPATASPRVRDPFRAAREASPAEPLSAAVESRREQDTVLTRAQVKGQARLVSAAKLFVVSGGKVAEREMARTDAFEANWPCALEVCEYYVALFDGFGNALAYSGTASAPLRAARSSPPVREAVTPAPAAAVDVAAAEPGQSIFSSPVPYLVTAGALVAVGAVFAWRMQADQESLRTITNDRANHTYAEVQTLDGARQRSQVLIFTFFGTAAAAGAAAIFVW